MENIEKKIDKMESDLIKKYGRAEVIKFRKIYNEAIDLMIMGSEVEDKEGLEQASRDYYDEAELIKASLPEDYIEFRELLSEYGY